MAGTNDPSWERLVAERLGRIEEKVDNIVHRLDDGHDLHLNHGCRIGALERWRAYILGALAVISIVLVFLFKVM
ncbi:hypothetical protein LCGC14_2573950 [marine sediment metagenome]|uniref:Uncharacterized protein n=1 Tax=marine sediment metagenome TaxID=412755 RepID=A0A0F9B4A6_9ZZZZ